MDPTIEPTGIVERPKEVARAAQFLLASLAIGLVRAIFGLVQRVSGVPLIVALLITCAVFGVGFALILRISATKWSRIIKTVLLATSVVLALVALTTAFSSDYLAALAFAVTSALAYVAYRQRHWARIILLVLVLFGLPFAIRGNVAELKQSIASGSLSIIITILQMVGTYLLFTSNSNLWFRRRK